MREPTYNWFHLWPRANQSFVLMPHARSAHQPLNASKSTNSPAAASGRLSNIENGKATVAVRSTTTAMIPRIIRPLISKFGMKNLCMMFNSHESPPKWTQSAGYFFGGKILLIQHYCRLLEKTFQNGRFGRFCPRLGIPESLKGTGSGCCRSFTEFVSQGKSGLATLTGFEPVFPP